MKHTLEVTLEPEQEKRLVNTENELLMHANPLANFSTKYFILTKVYTDEGILS